MYKKCASCGSMIPDIAKVCRMCNDPVRTSPIDEEIPLEVLHAAEGVWIKYLFLGVFIMLMLCGGLILIIKS